MPDFSFKETFPIASVADLLANKAYKEELLRQQALQNTIGGISNIGQGISSYVDAKKRMAQALTQADILLSDPRYQGLKQSETMAPNRPVAEVMGQPVMASQVSNEGIPNPAAMPNPAGTQYNNNLRDKLAKSLEGLGADKFAALMKPQDEINLITQQVDANGNPIGTNVMRAPKGSSFKIAGPSRSSSANPHPSDWTDQNGNPLAYNGPTNSFIPVNVPNGVKPTLKKGDESAIADANLLANQIPNIETMFNAYSNSKSPRLQSTELGRLLDPAGKQAENALKLAAFSFGGKNLTNEEKKVVYGALFPSWTDNDESRAMKKKLLTEYASGKIDLYAAANLLGPAGAPLKEMLQKKLAEQKKEEPNNAPQSKDVLSVGGTFHGQTIVGVRKKK